MSKGVCMKKKIGVIGGLGTDTAAMFYIQLERLWSKAGSNTHIPLTLENIQAPFSLEQSATNSIDRIAEFLPFLIDAATSLEKAGATLIVIPCNTVHVHIEAVRSSASIPVVSITQEVAKELRTRGVKTAAILGTRTTRQSGIYAQACEAEGIDVIYPNTLDQTQIESIIQHALSWTNDTEDTKQLLRIIHDMRAQGADAVVLACTDLQLCMPSDVPSFVVDSMHTLAQSSIRVLLDQ